jgi:hypothetical protein
VGRANRKAKGDSSRAAGRRHAAGPSSSSASRMRLSIVLAALVCTVAIALLALNSWPAIESGEEAWEPMVRQGVPPVVDLQSELREAVNPLITGRVVSVIDDRPVSSARVVSWLVNFTDRRDEPVVTETQTNEEGSFSLVASPAAASQTRLLAITADGYVAQVMEGVDAGGLIEARLREQAINRVLVRNSDGTSEPDAEVLLVSSVVLPNKKSTTLRESFKTDSTGSLVVRPLSPQFEVWAKKGPQESARHTTLESETRLTLRKPVTLSGLVTVPPEFDTESPRISAVDSEGHSASPPTIDSTGTWQTNVLAVSEWTVRAEGPGLVPQQRVVQSTDGGDIRDCDFHLVGGHPVSILAHDTHKNPIEGAKTFLWWLDASNKWVSDEADTGATGLASFVNAPDQDVWIRAKAEGFSSAEAYGPFAVTSTSWPQTITIESGGSLKGRCLHQGRPVSEFEVLYWYGDNRPDLKRQLFTDHSGEFKIEGVRAGEIRVFAQSKDLPMSEVLILTVGGAEEPYAELELPTPAQVSGAVVDSVTSEPIVGASLEVYMSTANDALSRWGRTYVSGEAGEFNDVLVSPRKSMLVVTADSYARRGLVFSGASAGFGTIALNRRQPLTVRLVGCDSPENFELETSGNTHLERTAFRSDGVISIPSASPGLVEMRLHMPGGDYLDANHVLHPGADWEVVIDLQSSRTVHVSVRCTDETPTEGMWLGASFKSASGAMRRRYVPIAPDGIGKIDYVEGAVITVDVLEPSVNGVQRHASRTFELDAQGESHFEVLVSGKSETLRILDGNGQPVANALVVVSAVVNSTNWFDSGNSDRNGLFRVRDTSVGRLSVAVAHPVSGWVSGVLLDEAHNGGEFVDVIFDPHETLQLELTDNGEPVVGATVTLLLGGAPFAMERGTTDHEGAVTWSPVSVQQPLQVEISGPGIWPETHKIPGVGRHEVEVLSTGSAAFVLPGPEWALVKLSSSRGSAVDYLQGGRVRTSTGSNYCDEEGAMRIDGLPVGKYAWEFADRSGAHLRGTVTIEGRAVTSIRAE